MKQNKMLIQNTIESICVDQLLLSLVSALECGWYMLGDNSSEKSDIFFPLPAGINLQTASWLGLGLVPATSSLGWVLSNLNWFSCMNCHNLCVLICFLLKMLFSWSHTPVRALLLFLLPLLHSPVSLGGSLWDFLGQWLNKMNLVLVLWVLIDSIRSY